MNGNYLTERLAAIGITNAKNNCQGFKTFKSYHYSIVKDEYYNLTNEQKDRLKPSPFDNILFTYSDIWGQRIYYKSKEAKWTKTVQRIRYHEENRFEFWDQATGEIKRSPKYHTAKGGKVSAFFNGLYAYYIKPLQEKGLTQKQMVQQLQPTFRRIVITEGEFKAFAGCHQQIPTIGISGIHNAVHTIKQMRTTKDLRQYEYTTDADFLQELQEFFDLFQVQEVVFLMDQDAFDNQAKELRSKSFFAAVRNMYYASRNAQVQLHFAYILPSVTGKGLDDILEIGEAALIRRELLQFSPSWQEREASPNKKSINEEDYYSNQQSPHGVVPPLPLGERLGERSYAQPTYIYQTPITKYEQLEKLQFAFAQSVKSTPYFFATDHEHIQAKEGAKLSEVISIEDTYDKTLIAPTGSGKTYLVATCPDWKIIVCPTISLCKNVAAEYNAYQFDGKEIVAFEKMMKNFEALDVVYQFLVACTSSLRDKKTPSRNANFIAVTYKSFRKLTAYLTLHTHKFRVFIDESQNFTTSTSPSYLLKELKEVIQLSTAYQSTTLLTGTYLPAFHPTIAQMPIIQVHIPKPPKTAKLLACSDTLKAAEQLSRTSIEQGRFPMILFNSKNDSGKLGTLKSYLKDLDFAFFNANTKEDADWKSITNDGIIADKYQGMCVTSVLKEGNNIYNHYNFDIIIIGSFHSSEIEQFCNRPRNPQNVRLFKLISNKAQISDSQKSIYSIATNLLYKAIATCQQLNSNEGNLEQDLLEREFMARQFIASLPIQLDEHGRCQIDELRLSNQAFQFDRIQENRNDDLLRRRLARYQIQLSPVTNFIAEKTEDEKALSRDSRLAAKQKKEAAFDQLYQELQSVEIFTHASRKLTHEAKQLNSVEKKVYKRILSVTNLITDKAQVLSMLKQARLSGSKFTLLRRQYIIHCLKTNAAYRGSERPFSQLLKDIYSSFSIKERSTAKEIKSKLLDALHKDPGIDTSRMKQDTSNRLAMKVFKLFFEVEGKKVNGNMKYHIRETYWAKHLALSAQNRPINLPLTKDGYPDFWQEIA